MLEPSAHRFSKLLRSSNCGFMQNRIRTHGPKEWPFRVRTTVTLQQGGA
jgi:hypothetical protein